MSSAKIVGGSCIYMYIKEEQANFLGGGGALK